MHVTLVPCPDKATWEKVKRIMTCKVRSAQLANFKSLEFPEHALSPALGFNDEGGAGCLDDYRPYRLMKSYKVIPADEYLTPKYTL